MAIFKIGAANATVDNALVHFTRALEALRAVSAQQDAESAKLDQQILDGIAAKAVADAESSRALRAIAKIEQFVL